MSEKIERHWFDDYIVPCYAPASFIPVKGKGSRIWDQANKEYIDFAGGIAVNALGHAHPEVVKALHDQAQKLWHVSNAFTNEPALKLAQSLVKATFADKVFFCNSGAEANEAALKLARKYAHDHFGEEKSEIIGFNNAFHGRTLFTVSVGGQPKYSQDFKPLPAQITHLPYNDLSAVAQHISNKTCAVIVEPIQGEGGVTPATPEFLKGLRKLCDQHQAALIFDEVQTGMGRTGTLYTYMDVDVIPDILTTAKSLGAGFPIGGMLTTNRFAKTLSVGTHGTTYGGNPLATAVANAVFSIIHRPETMAHIQQMHQYFMMRLNNLFTRFQFFKEIRGKGLLIGIELNETLHGKAKDIVALAAEYGVLILVAGPNVLRFAPALNITQEEAEQGFDRLEKALEKLSQTHSN